MSNGIISSASGFYCQICKVNCPNENMKLQHMNGKKHKKKAAAEGVLESTYFNSLSHDDSDSIVPNEPETNIAFRWQPPVEEHTSYRSIGINSSNQKHNSKDQQLHYSTNEREDDINIRDCSREDTLIAKLLSRDDEIARLKQTADEHDKEIISKDKKI